MSNKRLIFLLVRVCSVSSLRATRRTIFAFPDGRRRRGSAQKCLRRCVPPELSGIEVDSSSNPSLESPRDVAFFGVLFGRRLGDLFFDVHQPQKESERSRSSRSELVRLAVLATSFPKEPNEPELQRLFLQEQVGLVLCKGVGRFWGNPYLAQRVRQQPLKFRPFHPPPSFCDQKRDRVSSPKQRKMSAKLNGKLLRR